jgi:hypothetical protein
MATEPQCPNCSGDEVILRDDPDYLFELSSHPAIEGGPTLVRCGRMSYASDRDGFLKICIDSIRIWIEMKSDGSIEIDAGAEIDAFADGETCEFGRIVLTPGKFAAAQKKRKERLNDE